MSTQTFSKVFNKNMKKHLLNPFKSQSTKILGAPGAVHPDPIQGADERAPTVNGPHLSVRPRQGRR